MMQNPTVHGRLKYRTNATHAGDSAKAVFDFAEERYELLLLVAGILRIDRSQITAAGLESEVLVLPIAQALAEHRSCAQQYQRHSRLPDHQRLLRPLAIASNGAIDSAQRFDWLGARSHPGRCNAEDDSSEYRESQREEQH